MSIEQEVKDKAVQMQQIDAKIKELETINRICGNTLNLVNDMEIKGAYAKPVAEVTDWLTGLKTQIQVQIDQIKVMLPNESAPSC